MRYLGKKLLLDLREKAVLLSGPRQVGKTYLAKDLAGSDGVYLNSDVRADAKIINSIAWLRTARIVVLDELHKRARWKSFLKGIIDDQQNKPQLLVTGSARLETFRKGGEALTGRTFHYHLHPLDLIETRMFLPNKAEDKRLERLLTVGGFPESFLSPKNATRLLNDRLDAVVRGDVRDLTRIGEIRALELLIELLRERVGSDLNYQHLAADVGVSAPTVKTWIDLLEQLYLVFRVYPHSRGLARSLRKQPKLYFFDWSAAQNPGAVLENLVACSLQKFCDWTEDTTGRKIRLCYFRDRDGHEVDFLLVEGSRVHVVAEVKQAEETLHKPLTFLAHKLGNPRVFQLVKEMERPLQRGNVEILPLAGWLGSLDALCFKLFGAPRFDFGTRGGPNAAE
jgi:uncharacterized protein